MKETWKQRARQLRDECHAVYLASRDPRVPSHVRLLAAFVVAYALSPIDLIPDFIPILGYLDDLVLIPLGIALVIRLIPRHILAECRARVAEENLFRESSGRWAAAMVLGCWLVAAGVLLRFVW